LTRLTNTGIIIRYLGDLARVPFYLRRGFLNPLFLKTGSILTSFGLLATAPTLEQAAADVTFEPQTILHSQKAFNLFELDKPTITFERINYEIIETKPQLKEINKSVVLSDRELIDILIAAGFSGSGLAMAWAVVKQESSARPYAHNDNPNTGDNSYGLFQINMINSLGPSRRSLYGLEDNNELFDPLKNAEIAYKISNGGTNWNAWTTKDKAINILIQFPG
jgi:hypothetical protein